MNGTPRVARGLGGVGITKPCMQVFKDVTDSVANALPQWERVIVLSHTQLAS